MTIILAGPGAARAADGTWIGGDNFWGSSGNWLNGIVANGIGSTAYFTNGPGVCNLNVDVTLGHLRFDVDSLFYIQGYADHSKVLTLATLSGTSTVTTVSKASIGCHLAGTNGLIKLGWEALYLRGDSKTELAGDIVVREGEMVIRHYDQLGTNANLIIEGNRVVNMMPSHTFGGLSGSGELNLGDSFSGTAARASVGAGGQSSEFSGRIQQAFWGGGSVTKLGGGTLTLSGTNTYSGGTTLAGGILSVSQEEPLGSAAGLTFTGGTLRITGTIMTNTWRTITWTDGGGGFDIAQAGHVFTLSQPLGGAGGLSKSGAGILAMTGTNSYTGGTTIDAGTLRLTNGSERLADTGAVQVNAAGTLELTAGLTETIGGLSGTGTVYLTGTGSALRVGGGDSTATFDGPVTGSGGLVKIGAGVQTLTNTTSTYSGGTVLLDGVLSVSQTGNLGAVSGALMFSGGTLRVTGKAYSSFERPMVWGAAGGGLDIANSMHTFDLNRSLTGTGSLTKLGLGYLDVSADNSSYSGTIYVAAGKLLADASNDLGSATVNVNGGQLSIVGGSPHCDSLIVGDTGSGYASQQGGTTQFQVLGNARLGNQAGSVGNYDINLGGGSFRAASLQVGYYGTGSFSLGSSTSKMQVDGTLAIGEKAGSYGYYALSAGNLTAGELCVGIGGSGRFTQSAGASTNGTVWIAQSPGSSGLMQINGGTARVNADVYVGGSATNAGGAGTLSIGAGGYMTVGGKSYVGCYAGSDSNAVTVAGAGATWNTTSNLFVGKNAAGNRLTITNGGVVTVTGPLNVGYNPGGSNNGITVAGSGQLQDTSGTIGYDGANNSVVVTGANSLWNNSANILVGDHSAGNQLTISSGGAVTVGGNAYVGYAASASNNQITVAGGSLTVTNAGGTGTLDVRRGTVTLNSGTVTVDKFYATNGANSVLAVGLAGLGSNVVLTIGGNAQLGGTLNVTNLNGFTPALSNAFTVLTATSVLGTFAFTNLPALDAAFDWSVTHEPTAVVLRVENGTSPYALWAQAHIPDSGQWKTDQNPDNDAFNNWQEYIADTDPTNAASFFRITDITHASPVTVYFGSSTGRVYTMQGRSNLVAGVWTNVSGAGPRFGAGGADSMADTNEPTAGPFYRMKANLP
jgi:T5SS/PEP-CTERM-associated repeat protein/autotransporter-associated beta strand protein